MLAEPEAGGPRVVAGSASDLTAESRSLRVLEEFRCLLGTLMIELPPLRERLADLPALAETLLRRAAELHPDAGREGPPSLTVEALDVVRSHGWPGNLRELYAVLAGALARSPSGRIEASALPMALRLASQPERAARGERPLPLATILEEAERRLIQLALKQAKGNKTRAAELLGVYKPLLYRRMTALGLAKDE